MEQNGSQLGNRSWQRHNCGTEGVFVADEFQSKAIMVDASPGGFKLRFEQAEAVTGMLSPPPKDLLVTNNHGTVFSATVLWAKGGLAGARFYSYLSLDEVVTLMTGRFTVKLGK